MAEKRRKGHKNRTVVIAVLVVTVLIVGGLLARTYKGKTDGGDGKGTDMQGVTVTDAPEMTTAPVITDSPPTTESPGGAPTPVLTTTPEPTSAPKPTATPTPVLEKLYFPSSESIPVISIKTEGEQPIISRDIYVNCEVTVGNVDAAYDMRDVKAGIRVRGNSSSYYGDEEKILKYQVPYRIKFEKKRNLLGLNDGAEFKSWVLLRGDEGLVRDDIALRFGRLFLGERYYCSDARLVHLYVNEVFKGVYLLCEQSQVNKYRIDINEPEPGETGTDVGYLLEIDNAADADAHPFFRMNYDNVTLTDVHGVSQKITYANYSIKSEVVSKEQEKFISSYMKNMFRLVYEACENQNYLMFDEDYQLVPASYDNTKDTIEAVIDTESFVAMYMVFEIMRDRDQGEGSFYMCVDFSENSKYPKLTFLCPWDFDWTCQGDATGRYYAAGFDDPDFVKKYGDRSNPWFIMLAKEEWFMEMVREQWSSLQTNGLIYGCIEEEQQYLELYEADLNRKDSYATKSAKSILNWIEKRVKWLDEEWIR